jgi:NodT family efflux transporter outer membrane factor (OMF) lipoprotein
MIKTSLTAVALAALLSACGTLPEPVTPAPDLPQRFAQAQAREGADVAPAAPDAIGDWAVFADPVLDALVRRAFEANLDLQQAAERVQRSRALAAGARAALAPGGGIGIDARAQQFAETEMRGTSREQRRVDIGGAGASLSWEIDLFGRLRQAAAAAGARADATQADADAMRVAVGAEVAHAWFTLGGLHEQLAVAHQVVQNRRATVDLVLRRVGAGYAAPLDEARARADLAAAEAELPALHAAKAVASHRLAVLLGESPSTFEPPAATANPASAAPPHALALHVPAPRAWAAARPDLRAAEARLRAQALDVEAIRAEFLPQLSITGALGVIAGSVSGLGAAGALSWFVAPSLSVPVFDTARIDARLQAARAGQREALLIYRQRVLLATEEVESALALVREGQLRLAALQQRARHALEAEGLARKRFEAGGTDLLELLDAQRTSRQADIVLVAAMTGQRQQIVALQRALGARFLPAADAATTTRLASAALPVAPTHASAVTAGHPGLRSRPN